MKFEKLLLGRRAMLRGSAAAGLVSCVSPWRAAFAETPEIYPFSRRNVLDEAEALAAKPFAPPSDVPALLKDLTYDLYRQIRYRTDEAVWGQSPTRFSIQMFAPGYLFKSGVDVYVVENARARALKPDANNFETPNEAVANALTAVGRFAGFRLHYPLNNASYRDEVIAFQGASYFRAVSRGQLYGLSARGLAIDVAEPTGEEFPIFRRFWIERPSKDSDAIVVHALLDSRRVTGAYRFGVYPGAPTMLDVDATLFARKPLNHVGIGALTSMYMHGPIDRADKPDYRPQVHDSQGLAIHTGQGERLWRPLNNPKSLQISAFRDKNPQGFGLIQRERSYDQYQDLEAGYEKRPSAWITPRGDWGSGQVQLVEIPSPNETNDNIVAYWRPDRTIEPGTPFELSYTLGWPNDIRPRGLSRVIRSAYGRSLNQGLPEYIIDFGPPSSANANAVEAVVSCSAGTLVSNIVQPNPNTGGFRVIVLFDPRNEPFSELRVQPVSKGGPVGETWLYRWQRD